MKDLLEIRGLRTSLSARGGIVRVLDGIDLSVGERETLGLVGESGAGKSVTALSILGLLGDEALVESGAIFYRGRDLLALSRREMRQLRGTELAMVFQEPGASLNPLQRVGDALIELLHVRGGLSREPAVGRAVELFLEVGLLAEHLEAFPHELSGGQKQRAMLAMAVALDPQLLVADEPTSALDVTVQAQILALIARLQEERGMAVLLISHDLGVVGAVAHRVAVLRRGRVVECGDTRQIFYEPKEPYTRALLSCRPRLGGNPTRLPTGESLVEEPGHDEMDPGTESQSALTARKGNGLRDSKDVSRKTSSRPLLEVRELTVRYPIRRARRVGARGRRSDLAAVDGISFEVFCGETLGVVGESGCGKTTAGLALLKLLPWAGGSVSFDGHDLAQLGGSRLRSLRRRMQVILQDPYASLSPRLKVGAMLTEAMAIHGFGDSPAARLRNAAALLEEVGLDSEYLDRYPHELSGGQRQRVAIARALAVEPELLVCDEAVSALDVSIQAQVLNLLRDLQDERQLTYLFISHDISVVEFMADRIAVMYKGRIVEKGPAETICSEPQHAHTRALIAAVLDHGVQGQNLTGRGSSDHRQKQ